MPCRQTGIKRMNIYFHQTTKLNEIKSFCRNEEEFIEKLFKRSENLSFITAIETEFKIDLMTLIKKKFKEK